MCEWRSKRLPWSKNNGWIHLSPSLLFVVILFLFPDALLSQSSTQSSISPLEFSSRVDSTSQETGLSVVRSQKSPTLALGLSAVLPGAGQFYTERYWRIPVIWGFGGYFVSQWLKADKKYRDFRREYRASLSAGRPDERSRLVRDFYRDERDKFGFYIAIVYILNVADAYVGASLYNFEVTDDLDGNISLKFSLPLK